MKLNAAGVNAKAPALVGVSPDIQWEVVYDGGRPDIVVYDHNPVTSPIRLIEVKTSARSGDARADAQLTRYELSMPTGSGGREIDRYDVSGYSDSFRMKVSSCATGAVNQVTDQYQVHPGSTGGVLLFTRIGRESAPCRDNPPPVPEEKEEPAHGQEELPDFCDSDDPCVVPAPGRDDDHDGRDDFFEKFLDAHPELGDLPVWPTLPATEPVTRDVVLTAASAAVIVAGIGIFCGATGGAGCLAFLTAAETGSASTAVISSIAAALTAAMVSWNLFGDPHIVTMDRRAYNLQAVGEFTFLDVPSVDVSVQARFKASGQNMSILDVLATKIDDERVEIGSSAVKVEGEPMDLADGSTHEFGDGTILARASGSYYLIWPTGMVMERRGGGVRFMLPPETETRGLLGNSNGDPSDDVSLPDGTRPPSEPSATWLHSTFADAWRVTDESSAFSYAPGESTATYTDKSFPANLLTLGDFSESVIAAASATCSQEGVLPGTQFDACVFDVALTGDASYADQAMLVTDKPITSGQRSFDTQDTLTESFENAVASNFQAANYATDEQTSRIAGPIFDTPGYRFYVPTIGRHNKIDVAFDLFTFGPTTTDQATQRLVLDVDGERESTLDLDSLEPTSTGDIPWTVETSGTGTTSTGQEYRKYRVSAQFDHSAPGLSIEFRPTNFRGVLGTSLGVDNVGVGKTVPDAQLFESSLPLKIGTVDLPTGAGQLESAGAQDSYDLTLDQSQSLVLTPGECTVDPDYELVNRATGDRQLWYRGCGGGTTTDVLPAGDYELRVTAAVGDQTGTYAFDLTAVPAPQTFDYTIGTTVSNGVPAVGAGNLETTSSEDWYAFTVPAGGANYRFEQIAGSMHLRVVNVSTGESQDYGYSNQDLVLSGGEYRLEFGSRFEHGPYSFKLYEIPAPQTFAYTLGSTVSDGVPGAGAGNLETKASVDRYTFTVPAEGGTYQYHFVSGYLFNYRVINADTDVVVDTRSSRDYQFQLSAGNYRIEFGGKYEVGQYSFKFYAVPPAQTFAYNLGSKVSNGVPAAGAGNLELPGSIDRYTFTIDTGGAYQYEHLSGALVDFRAINLATGEQVASGGGLRSQVQLPAGSYSLEFGGDGSQGTYSFTFYAVPPPQTFAYTLGTTVSNGVPASGAGNLETKASVDRYTFSLPAAGLYEYERLSNFMNYRVINTKTSVVYHTGSASSAQMNLPAGDYLIEVGDGSSAGTYSFNLYAVPPAQAFAYTLGSTVSNGIPASGAGNLETLASVDQYTFTLESAGSYNYERFLSFFQYRIINVATGQQVASGTSNQTIQLAAGDYRIEFGNQSNKGAYSFRLSRSTA